MKINAVATCEPVRQSDGACDSRSGVFKYICLSMSLTTSMSSCIPQSDSKWITTCSLRLAKTMETRRGMWGKVCVCKYIHICYASFLSFFNVHEHLISRSGYASARTHTHTHTQKHTHTLTEAQTGCVWERRIAERDRRKRLLVQKQAASNLFTGTLISKLHRQKVA